MVTPIPNFQERDIQGGLGRVGSAIESAAKAPMQGLSDFQTLQTQKRDLANKKLSGEKTQMQIDEKKAEIKAMAERGARFDALKKEIAIETLGSEEAFDSLFSSPETKKGRLSVLEEGPQPKPTPGTEGLPQSQRDLARKIMQAESKTELGLVMTEAQKITNAHETHKKKYGKAVAVQQPNFRELRVHQTGKDKYEIPYGDNYVSQLGTQTQNFLRKGAQKLIDDKLKNAKWQSG